MDIDRSTMVEILSESLIDHEVDHDEIQDIIIDMLDKMETEFGFVFLNDEDDVEEDGDQDDE